MQIPCRLMYSNSHYNHSHVMCLFPNVTYDRATRAHFSLFLRHRISSLSSSPKRNGKRLKLYWIYRTATRMIYPIKKCGFYVCVCVLEIFIAHGDTFLPDFIILSVRSERKRAFIGRPKSRNHVEFNEK